MTTQITEDGKTVKFDVDGVIRNIAKQNASVFVVPRTPTDLVQVYDASGQKVVLDFNEVTMPVVTSAEELREAIMNIINTDISTTTSAFGDLRTAELSPIFLGTFEYTVDNTELNVNTTNNGGTVTQAEAMAVVSTSTTTASGALLQTRVHARYKSGLGGLLRFSTLFSAPAAGTCMVIGLSDEVGSSASFVNGLMIGYEGTIFGLHRYQNDVKFTVAQADWDDPLDGTGQSGMTLDHTKLNIFAIQYQWLGGGPIRLWVESDKARNQFVPVHTIEYANQNTVPSMFNPNLSFSMFADNKATTDNITVKSASYGYFVEGKTEHIELHQPQFSSGTQLKSLVTTEIAIFTIRNKTQYAGKTNFIDFLVENVGAAIEANAANNLGGVRLIKNATLGGTPVWNDINTTDSIVEIDVAGTTITGGIDILDVDLAGKNDKESKNLSDFKIVLAPGETLTIAGASVTSATIAADLLWKELF